MFKNVVVDLSMFLNIVSYLFILFIIIVIYRFLVRKLYINRIIKKIKFEVIGIFTKHYIKYGLKDRMLLSTELDKLNVKMKYRYHLLRSPLDWSDDDLISYKSYYDINERFKLGGIRIYKKIFLYKINIRKYEYYKNALKYKDCIKDMRDNKLDNLLG